ncbi:MAG: MurR/RpiR family transcriptional regulator [Erysipelotrichaceae bacterium]
MNPIELIELHHNEFTKSELIIKNYVLNNLRVITCYPILEVAAKAKVSKSALLRFCQKCGYSGYSEFKYEISRFLISGENHSLETSSTTASILKHYTTRIDSIPTSITEDLLVFLSSAIKTARKIKIFGVHETGLSAQFLGYRLLALGIDAETCCIPSSMSEKSSLSTNDDLNIFLSLSGNTPIILESIQNSIDNKATTVLISENNHNTRISDQVTLMCLPTCDSNSMFVDSQAIIFIAIELLINKLAKQLNR